MEDFEVLWIYYKVLGILCGFPQGFRGRGTGMWTAVKSNSNASRQREATKLRSATKRRAVSLRRCADWGSEWRRRDSGCARRCLGVASDQLRHAVNAKSAPSKQRLCIRRGANFDPRNVALDAVRTKECGGGRDGGEGCGCQSRLYIGLLIAYVNQRITHNMRVGMVIFPLFVYYSIETGHVSSFIFSYRFIAF